MDEKPAAFAVGFLSPRARINLPKKVSTQDGEDRNFGCAEYLSACRLQASLTRSAPKMRTRLRGKSLGAGSTVRESKNPLPKRAEDFLAPATGIEPVTNP